MSKELQLPEGKNKQCGHRFVFDQCLSNNYESDNSKETN